MKRSVIDEAKACALYQMGEATRWLANYADSPEPANLYTWAAESLEKAAKHARDAARAVIEAEMAARAANDIAAAAAVAPVPLAAE